VDFFGDLPFHLQKPLRDLCLGRDCHNTSMKCPELESNLKLLYTGITRCIQRLFFVETRKSVAGDGFLRWIATTPKGRSQMEALAVVHTVDNVEKMTRTPDEWQSAGLDNAMMAEVSDSPDGAVLYLEKAIYCFEQIGDKSLAKKARSHRQSARFRCDMEALARTETIDSHSIELQVASVVEKLLSERLYAEVQQVCEIVSPYLAESTQSFLKDRLVSKLPPIPLD
jgi:hypothetical protein